MTQYKDQMRAEFEAAVNGKYRLDFADDDTYFSEIAQGAWEGWQLARASAPQGVPEAVIRETCESYQGTSWGKVAECICDAIMIAAAPQPVAQNIPAPSDSAIRQGHLYMHAGRRVIALASGLPETVPVLCIDSETAWLERYMAKPAELTPIPMRYHQGQLPEDRS